MDTAIHTVSKRVITLTPEEEFRFKPDGVYWEQPVRRIEVYRSYFVLFGGRKARERTQIGPRYSEPDEVPSMPAAVVDEVLRCLDAFWAEGDSVRIVPEMSA